MSGELSLDEIAAVLQAYWDATGEYDPMVNGTVEAEMAKVGNPNDPALTSEQRRAVIQERGIVDDRYRFTHELCVGQRIACRQLLYRFETAVKAKEVA